MEKEEVEDMQRRVSAHNNTTSRPKDLVGALKEYYESDIFKEKREKFKQIKSKRGEKYDSED